MDIITEIISLVLESYFGWDQYEIAELWRVNPGRRRSIIRRIGSALPELMPKIFTKRSIVREIGSRLPLPPVKRPRFKIGQNVHWNPDCTQLQEGEINWIQGPEYFEDTFSVGSEEDHSDGLLSLCNDVDIIDTINDSKQTSLRATSTPVVDNDLAMKKISALEDELNKLRAQIASLVVAPPTTPSVPSMVPALTSTPCTPIAPPPPQSVCTPLPPPPPPPPPACLTPVKSVFDVIKENRSRRKTIAGIPADKPTSVPNMSDVLKGLGSVKLKSIQRSPGGTPIRQKPAETEGTDPSSIIARALKKKFAQRRKVKEADSPSLDKENMSSFSPSPVKSPKKPMFGPHLLKSSKERRKSGTDLKERVLQTSPLVNSNA